MEQAEEHAYVTLTTDNFEEEVLKFPGVVLVDFWASWCNPCRAMAPHIEALAEKHKGNPQVKIAKLDVDAHSEISNQYQVLSIPTFKVFAKGEVVDQKVGVVPAPVLESAVDNAFTALTV
ncbi:MAG: thioredoxin [Patescibacteria group bacterium]|jgi:thioredoxin 1|nr:thioredoxin [Patescibacteria group bacterium]